MRSKAGHGWLQYVHRSSSTGTHTADAKYRDIQGSLLLQSRAESLLIEVEKYMLAAILMQ